ncbi:MAG: exodeoxyribonuclease V subunit beta, partial [Deltaproteobacteria bacterium]
MGKIKPLNLLETNLSGTHLIEAGAGTGKTYTITGLYLRLLLERRIPVDRILVVTFTKAATEELKDRIRRLLIETGQSLISETCRTPWVRELMERIEYRQEAVDRIQDAVREFDNAAIYTIHGFCHRILTDHAFDTGDLFETELAVDPSMMRLSIAEDYWRRRFYEAPPEFIGYAMERKYGPEYFYTLVRRSEGPVTVEGAPSTVPELHALKHFRETLKALKTAWRHCRREVETLLKSPSLSGVVYGSFKPDGLRPDYTRRDSKVERMLEEMDRYTNENSLGVPLCAFFENFTASKIQQATLKGKDPVSHPFFHRCEILQEIFHRLSLEMESLLIYLRYDCLKFAAEAFSLRKKHSNIQFFDDLLQGVHQALVNSRGEALAAKIRSEYAAALVDEFQDTDQIQFEIFYRIFAHKNNLLFMIGDPKQSIYSFRGADVFSYMKASSKAENRHTLLTNYRSDARLIQAVNTIFSNVKKPFVFDKIRFDEGRAGKSDDGGSSDAAAPFQLWWLASPDEDAAIPKVNATRRIAEAVAAEIGRLLYLHKKFSPSDIAVLVRTNQQAVGVKACLAAHRIPAVVYSAGNVFDTHEALELERVLVAIADPGHSGFFKAALVTEIIGIAADKLDPESIDPFEWDRLLAHFISYRRIWNEQGFIRMFSRFMRRESVRSRLLSYVNGERRLTNLMHLAELLHTASMEKGLGIGGLLKWLSIQRDQGAPRVEAHQLRLESDSEAVKIITIHKSKGLEFPVVFCPYAWGSSKITDSEVVYHDPDADAQYCLDFGSPQFEAHRILAQNELLAENLRLLYVALTRAEKRCYFAWGQINTAESSAPAYLLHGIFNNSANGQDLAAATAQNFRSLSHDELWRDLKKLEKRSHGSIAVVKLPSADTVSTVAAHPQAIRPCFLKKFSGEIDRTWRISSYSSFISNRTLNEELPDRDEPLVESAENLQTGSADTPPAETADLKDSENSTIFTFPRGAAAGIFFHDLFEHLDFSNPDPGTMEKLASQKLASHGIASIWQKPVVQTMQEVRRVALLPDRPDFSLGGLPAEKRVNEMAFLFPLLKTDPATLRNVFERHAGRPVLKGFPEQLGRLTFSPARGLMKGYIDMLFEYRQRYYLVDWKSNH